MIFRQRLLTLIGKYFLEWVTGALFVILLIVVLLGILDRYLFMFGWGWPEHLARLTFIVCSFFAAAVVVKDDEHFKADFLIKELLSPLNQRRLESVTIIMIMGILIFIIVTGIKLGIANWDQRLSSLPKMRMGLFQFAIPVSGLLMVIFYSRRLYAILRHKKGEDTWKL